MASNVFVPTPTKGGVWDHRYDFFAAVAGEVAMFLVHRAVVSWNTQKRKTNCIFFKKALYYYNVT